MLLFKDRIQAYLDAKGWTKTQFERATNIPHSTLMEIFKGTIRNPGADTLSLMVKSTDIDPRFLLTGEGQPVDTAGGDKGGRQEIQELREENAKLHKQVKTLTRLNLGLQEKVVGSK